MWTVQKLCVRQGECVQQGHVTETTESVSPSILDLVVTLMMYMFAFTPLQWGTSNSYFFCWDPSLRRSANSILWSLEWSCYEILIIQMSRWQDCAQFCLLSSSSCQFWSYVYESRWTVRWQISFLKAIFPFLYVRNSLNFCVKISLMWTWVVRRCFLENKFSKLTSFDLMYIFP